MRFGCLLTCVVAVGIASARPVDSRLVAAAAGVQTFAVDAASSQVKIEVGKTGVLSLFAGHTHEIAGPIESGTVDLDPDDLARSHVQLVIGTPALEVSAKGEPPDDVPKVQQAMDGDQVLAVARYPKILFESTSVALTDRQPSALVVAVTGRLTIRGTTRPMTVPVHVKLDGGSLVATGRFSIKQTAFGIQPISVAGVVKVKDTLEIEFSILARRP